MTDAVHAALAVMKSDHCFEEADVLAVSLSGEFAVRAKNEAPHTIRRLARVSTTGFSGKKTALWTRRWYLGYALLVPIAYLGLLASRYFQYLDLAQCHSIFSQAHLGV